MASHLLYTDYGDQLIWAVALWNIWIWHQWRKSCNFKLTINLKSSSGAKAALKNRAGGLYHILITCFRFAILIFYSCFGTKSKFNPNRLQNSIALTLKKACILSQLQLGIPASLCATKSGAVLIHVSIAASSFNKVLQSLHNPPFPKYTYTHTHTDTRTPSLVSAHAYAYALRAAACVSSAPLIHIDSWCWEETAPSRESFWAVVSISCCLCVWVQSKCIPGCFFLSKWMHSV